MSHGDGGRQWGDAAAVLPFGRRSDDERRYEDLMGDDGFDDRFDDGDDGFSGGYGPDLGHFTMVVMMDDKVVDTVRRPVRGSGYECAALELGRGTPRPTPRPTVVHVPMQPRHELALTWLRSLVGGPDELAALTAQPLPDEPLDVSRVPGDLRERVTAISDRIDAVALSLVGVEGRTACRRLLVRAVAAEPALLRGYDRDDMSAGAVLHAVAMANDLVGAGRAVAASALWRHLGLRSSPHDRARRFAHAVAGPDGVEVDLGHPYRSSQTWSLGCADLLIGRFRAFLIRQRVLADAEPAAPAVPVDPVAAVGPPG
ncbi:hypothetical protein [Pedococcus sp. P5_B7]